MPAGVLARPIFTPARSEAALAAWRVADLEARIKSAPPQPTTIKVAVMVEPFRYTLAYNAALSGVLQFNGADVAANTTAGNYLAVQTPDPRSQTLDPVRDAGLVVAFQPDIVVAAVTYDFGNHYMPLIEEGLASKPPQYVFISQSYLDEYIIPLVGQDDALRVRISGTRPAASPEQRASLAGFVQRYRQAYNQQHPDSAQSGYDAIYALAYAMLATGGGAALDGPRIDQAFGRLTSGVAIDVGTTDLSRALIALRMPGGTVDLRGTWTSLDWTSQREVRHPVGLYCIQRNGGNPFLVDDAGPRLDPVTGTVSGSYSCN
jgi:hypothetical protein